MRSGESKWYPGELLKCFRDERFSARGEKRMRDPRGFTLYIDTCQHARSRLLGHKARIPTYGARAIHGVPYELPNQNSSPNVPSGSQDSCLLRDVKKRCVKCESGENEREWMNISLILAKYRNGRDFIYFRLQKNIILQTYIIILI